MKIQNAQDLDNAIEALEARKKIQEGMLSDHFHATVDHFRPKNLIRSAMHNIAEPGSTGSIVLKTAGGLGAGLLAKSILFGKSNSFLGKVAASALKAGTTNTILHNSDKISAWTRAIYKNLFTKKKRSDA